MSQSIRQQRLARLNDTLAAWLAAHDVPDAEATRRATPKAPQGYHALPTPHDGLADDPRLARTAFVRAFVTQALLAAQQQAAGQTRAQLRGLTRARGLLLYRVARARHAAGQPLPLNPLWRERTTDGRRGKPRHVPAWALEPLGTARHQRAASDSPPPPYDPTTDPYADPYADPNNELIADPNSVIDLGDGVTMTGDEVQALWDAFVADPQGVLGVADTGDWVSLDEATQFFTDFARDPIGMVARYGGADGLMRYITGQLAADPQGLWDHLLTSVGPSLALGGAEGDALAFWATNGEVFDLTPEEIASAQAGGANAPTAAETDQIALSDQDIQYPYPDHLLAEGAVMSDLTIAQLLNSYWAQQDAQTAGQIALGDAGVSAGIVSSFDLVNPAMTDFLRQQAGALVTGIDERTRALLGDALWNAYSGINFAALPRDYRMADYLRNYLNLFNNDLQGMSRSRALLIARTEGARAANFGNMVAFARLGVRYVRWVTNAGACLICLGNGEVDYVKYGEDFPSRDKSPPAHPMCFPAGTVVSGPRAVASTERWYEGDLVELLTVGGHRLACTPNHPILTSQGWIAAGLLKVGDEVVCGTMREREAPPVNPDNQQIPARIEDVAHAVGETLGVPPRQVKSAAEDFHGDGMDGQVCIVRADGLLWDGIVAPLTEPDAQKLLVGRDTILPSLVGFGGPEFLLQADGDAAHGGVSSLGLSAALFGRKASGFDAIGLTISSPLDASESQPRRNCCARYAKRGRQGILGLATQVPSHQLPAVNSHASHSCNSGPAVSQRILGGEVSHESALPQDATKARRTDVESLSSSLAAFASDIRKDCVLKISVRPIAGHVYNLQTEPGWYLASTLISKDEQIPHMVTGIVVHNCRCVLGPYVTDEFNPNDWTELPLSPDDVAAMLFDPDYGTFPKSDWPITADDASAPTSASASDLGLLDPASMSPALQSVLTPDAIASLQAALGGAADDAAQGWLDDQGLPIPQTIAGVGTIYFDPEQADAEPQYNPDTLTRIRAQFGQAVDDFLASMQDAAAGDEGDIEGE